MSRIFIDDGDPAAVECILDDGGYDYDWDSGNRLIVNDEDADVICVLLREVGIRVEVI